MSVSDDFNRADGGLGGNWTSSDSSTPPQISSNTVFGGSAAFNAAHWTANSFNADHTSQITKVNASFYMGPGVRMSTGGNYYAYYGVGSTGLQKLVGGVQTILGNSDIVGAGDVSKITIVGTTITVYLNGVAYGGGPVTDSSLASGAAGLVAYGTAGSADDWLATGEVSGGGGTNWGLWADASRWNRAVQVP